MKSKQNTINEIKKIMQSDPYLMPCHIIEYIKEQNLEPLTDDEIQMIYDEYNYEVKHLRKEKRYYE